MTEQQELRKLDSVRAINKLMIDAEIKVGHREQHIEQVLPAKQSKIACKFGYLAKS